ncbi:MAG: helix-turn-helix transcriptional regulator [Elusimicrobia bacterium]|nr:helix-turn-helix transcriptional regulator [Elusimicrobiota bacterium]
MNRKGIRFRDQLKERLKDPVFAKAFAEVDAEVRLAVALADAREHAGLTQAQLARKLRTKQSNISRIEQGSQNVTLRTLEKIAQALHCRLEVKLRPA